MGACALNPSLCTTVSSLIQASGKAPPPSSASTVFHDNEFDGIYASNKGTIHLHGEATAIHSNGGYGIYASDSGKVIIHLPSHHNTSYNNGGQQVKRNLYL